MNPNPMNRLNFNTDLPGGFSNKLAEGKLPGTLPEPLYLNLGCGNDIRDGFINIDLYNSNPEVVGMDIRNLELPDNSADLILASDILEHFSHQEVDSVLKEWARVLKPDAKLIIRCPNLKLQVKAYMEGSWDADIASYMIFGGQTNPGDYHCIGFDHKSIKKHLAHAGFDIDDIEDHDIPQEHGYINLNMTVKAIKRNLNIEASKEMAEKPTSGLPYDEKSFGASLLNPEEKEEDFTSEFKGLDFETEEETESVEDVNAAESVETISDKEETKKKLNLVWEGSQFVYHSLALINREQCNNLADLEDINLTVIPYEPDQFLPEGNDKYMNIKSNDIRYKEEVPSEISDLPYLWVRHQWPPKEEPPRGAKWIIMQPWEFSQLRKDFVDIFKKAAEIWTPSNYSRKCFVDSGIDFDKVQVIPNGIDPELFSPAGKKYELETNKKFKILFVGGTIFRKGIDLLLHAFENAFSSEDDICLIVKDMGGDSFYKGQTAKGQIEEITNKEGALEIIYIDEYIDEISMSSLYRSCDLFVSPYRGEGFSLPTLEAMACGLPVIVTEGGSTDDFVDEHAGWKIPSSERKIGNIIDGHELTGEASVLEPDVKYLEDLLKLVYKEPAANILKGIYAMTKARRDWNWNNSTLKLLSRIDALYDTEIVKNSKLKLEFEYDDLIIFGESEEYYKECDYNKAIEGFLSVIESDELTETYKIHALNRLTEIAINSDDLESAWNYNQLSLRIMEEHPDTILLKASILEKQNNLVDAVELMTPLMNEWNSLKYKSSFGNRLDDALVKTGNLFYQMNDLEGANQLFTSALKLNHENAEACYGAGLCFREAGVIEDARTMLEWAVKIDPELEEAKVALMGLDKEDNI